MGRGRENFCSAGSVPGRALSLSSLFSRGLLGSNDERKRFFLDEQ